jgi:hypothetical protein
VSYLPGGNLRIVEATPVLNAPGLLDAGTDLGRGHAVVLAAQFLVRHCGYFYMQIDAVQQGPADLTQVSLDDPSGAAAFSRRIGKMAARTPVQITTDTRPRAAGTYPAVVNRTVVSSSST